MFHKRTKVRVKYVKPFGIRYDCFYKGKKITEENNDFMPWKGELVLVERNMFLSKFWWLIAFFNLLFAFAGSFDDWKDEKTKQRKIILRYCGIISDDIVIEVGGAGRSIAVTGVESYTEEAGEEDKNKAKIVKRVSIAKKMLIVVPSVILAVVFAIIAACLLLRR